MDINGVIEKAAKTLPKGWSVNIQIEKDGYDVELETPENTKFFSIDGGDGIVSDINEAIRIAINMDEEEI